MTLRGKNVVWLGNSHSEPGSISLRHVMEPFFAREGAHLLRWEGRRSWSTGCYLDGSPCPRGASRPEGVEAMTRGADVVFLELGANDHPGSDYRGLIRRFIGAVRSSNPRAQIVWMGPPTAVAPGVRERHDDVASRQRTIVPSDGVRWIDSRPMTATGHASDGVHFTRPAYEAWGAQLQRAIRREVARASGMSVLVPIGLGALALGGFIWWMERQRPRPAYA